MPAIVDRLRPNAAWTDERAETDALGGWSKRALDILVSLLALLILAPLMLLLFCAVRASDGGQAVYRQRRIGLNGQEFECLKFRSMVLDSQARLDALLATDPEARAEWAETQKLKVDPRITPLGDFLRKSSLDELPQLFNILKGEMSVVGPRPIIAAEVVRYGDHFESYRRTRPGLTGLWQISGRSEVTYDERVQMDADYVANWSPVRDVSIMFATVPAVLLRRGSC